MLELILISLVAFLALCCLGGLIKLLVGLVLLPIKIVLGAVGGILTLLVGIPLLLAGLAVAGGLFPAAVVIFVLLLPVAIVCGLIAILWRLVF